MNVAPQPSPGALVRWAVTPWVCQTLPTEALAELKLKQWRQRALAPEAGAEASPVPAKVSPGQP